MITLASILVDIDPVAADHPALEQAVSLATRCGARVQIVDVLPWVPAGVRHFVTPDLEKELVDHRRERLMAIGDAVQVVPVTTELLRGRPGIALIQEVLRSGHDLLMRSHGRDLAEVPRPFGAIDMELLRQCPCPVWLVGRRGSPSARWRILAAIHANPSDAAEQELNGAILDWALTLKAVGDAELTLLQAWTPYGASLLRSRMSPDEFAEFIEAARRTEDEALSGFVAPLKDRLTDVAVELVEGEPEGAIARFVESHGIDMVVMGTVARTGIAGLVMGNTAERVLQRLRGSVLAVKPPGFKSPVKQTSGRRSRDGTIVTRSSGEVSSRCIGGHVIGHRHDVQVHQVFHVSCLAHCSGLQVSAVVHVTETVGITCVNVALKLTRLPPLLVEIGALGKNAGWIRRHGDLLRERLTSAIQAERGASSGLNELPGGRGPFRGLDAS